MNTDDPLFNYHKHLQDVADADIAYVRRKDKAYSASWKRRGGPGAFFTLVRPWDRFESMAAGYSVPYDIFTLIMMQGLEGPDGSAIACVRDMRRYLLLLECEMAEQLQGAGNEYGAPEPQPPAPGFKIDFTTTCPVCLKTYDIRRNHQCDGSLQRTVLDDPSMSATGNMSPPPRAPGNPLNSKGEPTYIDRPCWELQDGLTMEQLRAAAPGFYVEGKRIPGEYTQYIVNRDCEYFDTFPETVGHLPRLEFELNNKELEHLPKWYHGLYEWVEAETKWRLYPVYRNKAWMK